MQSATRIAVSALLIASALASAYQGSTKLRRNGVLSLYPFPRVGRAQKQTWLVPLEEPQLEYTPEQKRELLNVFPRVGRSDDLSSQQLLATDIREMATDNKEYVKRKMYAFPRVGRSGMPFTLEQPRALRPQFFKSERPLPLPPQHAMAEQQFQQTTPVLTSLDNHRLHELMELMLVVRRNSLVKRKSAKGESGMWFGPRMGRAARDSEDDNIAADNQINELNEPQSDQQALDEERRKRPTPFFQ